MLDLLRCLFGYWPRRRVSACPIIRCVVLSEYNGRQICSVTRRLPSGSTIITTENLAKE